ncbi:hypothetical protein CC80DRAFT_532175 [Byssothecium circinans]|uniref:Uncharacterized protein n=1 Tax=Byssothecium circinans TaxID=147558 RepID=A0A6A5U6I7_9PLEO|nr:hypothetical protein CC80DRAFT_532175 [Byssothecium circinans]
MTTTDTPLSPVSPIQPSPPPIPSRNSSVPSSGSSVTSAPSIATITSTTQNQVQPGDQAPVVQSNPSTHQTFRTDWLPFTLRWYFLLIPISASLAFSIALSVLCWYSGRNYGLGKDDGSSSILFGWRFTPTLVAVLYTQTTVILFEDVKRTEPFARLAGAPSGGASAYGTLLQTPKAWWAILIDLTFKRKNVGKTSWALICGTIVYVLALLAVSPLSSALLTSEEVVVPRTVPFKRLALKANTQYPLNPTRETYFRTISALSHNITTSAWVSDTSLTFPFWPAAESAQLGPHVESNHGSWETNTIQYSSSLTCQNMTLESAEIGMKNWKATDWHQYEYNGTQPLVSFVLTSANRCRYELDVHPGADLAYNGGITWSSATTFHPLEDYGLNIEKLHLNVNVSATSPYARVRTSKECNDQEIIIMSTPWTSPISLDVPGYMWPNQTYTRSPDFRMRALLCETQFSSTQRTISATMSDGSETLLEDAPGEIGTSGKIPQSLVNFTRFQDLSLGDQWKKYVSRQGKVTELASRKPSSPRLTFDEAEVPQWFGFSGLGVVLGSISAWNVTAMIDDRSLTETAARIKGRFFMELVRDTFTDPELMQSVPSQGKVTLLEDRVMVLQEVGIILASCFAMSFLLLLVTFWSSRLPRRPLNLSTDPSSTVGLSILLNPRTTSMSTLRKMHNASKRNIHATLRSETFFTSNSTLFEDDSTRNPKPVTKPRKQRNWRPQAIRLKNLFALGVFLTLLVAALLILQSFSLRSRLYQQAFTHETDLSKFGLSISTFAPISIAPTITSIIVTLWWDQLDMTFRLLQPYIAMSRSPTPISSGAGLTYRSKTWIGAATKAAWHRHWILFLVTVGSTLCQVLTVSMSALFDRRAVDITGQVRLNRTFESRQVPLKTTIAIQFDIQEAEDPTRGQTEKVMDQLYQDSSRNWLYAATVQLSLNGSQLAWTQGEWNFVPVDLSGAQGAGARSNAEENKKNTRGSAIISSRNVTLHTSAMRAWLRCEPVDQTANQSSWLEELPAADLSEGYSPNATDLVDGYQLKRVLFENTTYSTTVLSQRQRVSCCANGSASEPRRAAIGYWSPPAGYPFPYDDQQWPFPFVSKWIVGNPKRFASISNSVATLYYEKPPAIQAASCKPVIDVAEATVLVNQDTGFIYSYNLSTAPQPMKSAWSEVFQRHDLSDSNEHYHRLHMGHLNFTTSFGILFLGGLLGAAEQDADIGSFEDVGKGVLNNAFRFRDQVRGLNMDLMSYSMYELAGQDPEALLNYTTLTTHANRTFQTFFQHFVNNKLSKTEGGWAYQKINEKLEGLGRPVDINGTAMPNRTYAVLDTNNTVAASVSNRVQVLYVSPLATYLSVGITIWLIGTTAVITCIQRKYTSSLLRNVELIADVLVLVAGSDRFLELVQEKGIALKRNSDVLTKLGWFKGRDGQVRWGIEVVGGREAIEWVDPPMKAFP